MLFAFFFAVVSRLGLHEAWQLPLTILMIVLAVAISRRPVNVIQRLEVCIGWVALRPNLALSLLAAASIAGPLALRPFLGFPDPTIPDEFSLILQAKTLLAGKLANPPLPRNFATDWVILSPAYASQYPIFRSLPLLIGYAVGVGAWGGVVLSMAALVCAVYWMVRVWIDARYAFVAAMIVILRFGLFSTWVNSHMGSAFTALGGVLLLGGYAIMRSRPTVAAGGLLGLGCLILITTRPFEGLCYAAPFGGALVILLVRSNAEGRKSFLVPGAVAAALSLAGFGLTFADNLATTGNWMETPYAVFNRTYGQPPAFLPAKWDPEPSSATQYDWLQRRREADVRWYRRRSSPELLISAEIWRFRNYWNFYVGFALSLPFALGLWALQREPALLLSAAALALALVNGTYDHAHYAAPGFGLVVLAIMLGFRALRDWKPLDSRVGLALSRTLPLAVAIGMALPLSSTLFGNPQFLPEPDNFNASCCWMRPRSLYLAIDDEIRRTNANGRNLVVVDTGSRTPMRDGVLVANEPSVADARSIWVNYDPEYNAATIERYPNRRIWRLGWLDDGSPCLQLFGSTPTQDETSLSGSLATLLEDPDRSWFAAPSGQCPGGLTRPPWTVSTRR